MDPFAGVFVREDSLLFGEPNKARMSQGNRQCMRTVVQVGYSVHCWQQARGEHLGQWLSFHGFWNRWR